MTTSNDSTLDKIRHALEWRYATKSFNPEKKISQKDWSLLEDSLVLSPSSYGLQPWRFLNIVNADLRQELKAKSWNQGQVTDASHFIVFTTLKEMNSDYIREFIELNASVKNIEIENLSGFEKMLNKNITESMSTDYILHWNQRQSYIAMGFLLETAALLGIDALPMEGIDPKGYDQILGLDKTNYGSVAAVALGYRADDDKYQHAPKVRFSKEKIIQNIL